MKNRYIMYAGWIGGSNCPTKDKHGAYTHIYRIETTISAPWQSFIDDTMHEGWAKIFDGSPDAPLRRTLASIIRWWYQINHPNTTGGSLVDDMAPLSCLYNDYLRRHGRREEDVMVAWFFATRHWWIWWREGIILNGIAFNALVYYNCYVPYLPQERGLV